MKTDLKKRVEQFQMLELPGQPQMMHMGTAYLVHDLWCAVKELSASQQPDSADRDKLCVCESVPHFKQHKIHLADCPCPR